MAKNVSRGVGGKEAKEEFDILNRILKTMEEGKDIRAAHWSAAEIISYCLQSLLCISVICLRRTIS